MNVTMHSLSIARALRGNGEATMITEELGNMEAEMNVEQEVSTDEGGQELKAQESPSRTPSPLHDEPGPVSNNAADGKEEEAKRSTQEELGSTLEKSGAREEQPADQVQVVVATPMHFVHHIRVPFHLPKIALPVGPEDISAAQDTPNSSARPSASNAPREPELPPTLPTVPSPRKKPSKKGRLGKKNGGKKIPDKVLEELPRELSQSRDAGAQTDQQDLGKNVHDHYLGRNASYMTQHRAAEGQFHETAFIGTAEDHHDRDHPHVTEPTTAAVNLEKDLAVEQDQDASKSSSLNLKTLRSCGIWADVSEDIDTRATNEMELEGSPSNDIRGNTSCDSKEQECGARTELALEGTQSGDIGAGTKSHHNEQELRGKSHQALEESQSEDMRACVRTNHKQHELRGNSQQTLEGSKTQDGRADNWNHCKEQNLRGKSHLGPFQACSEMNWRRRPVESEARQDTLRGSSKLGLDGDNEKDEQQDFRVRTHYGVEPQATHRNWIPRRGLHRAEGEGRATEQNKARGKGKQGREGQVQYMKDFARQKFEADLRTKQQELLQKSKQSLKAEFYKAKRIEQARKGRDELEMELNENLFYEEGELFYLNL